MFDCIMLGCIVLHVGLRENCGHAGTHFHPRYQTERTLEEVGTHIETILIYYADMQTAHSSVHFMLKSRNCTVPYLNDCLKLQALGLSSGQL